MTDQYKIRNALAECDFIEESAAGNVHIGRLDIKPLQEFIEQEKHQAVKEALEKLKIIEKELWAAHQDEASSEALLGDNIIHPRSYNEALDLAIFKVSQLLKDYEGDK